MTTTQTQTPVLPYIVRYSLGTDAPVEYGRYRTKRGAEIVTNRLFSRLVREHARAGAVSVEWERMD